MQITSSSINLAAKHSLKSQRQVDESVRAWVGDRRPDFEGTGARRPGGAALLSGDDMVALSEKARATAATGEVEAAENDGLSGKDKATIRLLEKLLEQTTGKKIKIQVLDIKALSQGELKDGLQAAAGAAQAARSNERAGWGVEYDRVEHIEEHEQTSFSAEGVVQTADGKEIKLNIDLSLSRSFVSHNETHLRAGDAVRKDPLVINFSGNSAELTTQKFSFDIDSDGAADQLSFVKSGSGFLALDKNKDGKINNGGELFGATTGNGFAELQKYDSDGNQWIDSGDPVFDKLQVWTKNAQGQDQLLALGQVGVGAIYLGNVATPFSLNDSNNQQLGQLQATGLWLGEQGQTGTVQHVDLVV